MTGVERYIKWIENDSDYRNIDYYCNTVKASKKRGVKSKKPWNNGGAALPEDKLDHKIESFTFKLPRVIDDVFLDSINMQVNTVTQGYEIRTKKVFDTSKIDELGFYKTSFRGRKSRIWSIEDVNKEKKSGLNAKTNTRHYVGYEDFNDNTSGSLVVNIYVPNAT